MKLIIGGAYQGKTDYVKEHYALSEEEILNGADLSIEEVYEAKAVKNFHRLIEKIESDEEGMQFVQKLCQKNPSIILITDEIGYGIVPSDKKEREWRERVGRVCCLAAERSETVIRVSCGIAMALKGRE